MLWIRLSPEVGRGWQLLIQTLHLLRWEAHVRVTPLWTQTLFKKGCRLSVIDWFLRLQKYTFMTHINSTFRFLCIK